MVEHKFRMNEQTLALSGREIKLVRRFLRDSRVARHTMRRNGLSPKPTSSKTSDVGRTESRSEDVQVSQMIGNSLCSHPALLMSAFGGILDEVSQVFLE